MNLRRSRRLAALLLAAHLAAGLTLIPLDVPSWIKALLGAALGLRLARSLWKNACLRAPGSPVALEIASFDKVDLQTRNGRRVSGRLLSSSYVSPGLTVLNVRVEGRLLAQHVVILADSLDAEDFRRLRVLLRWGGPRHTVRQGPASGSAPSS